MRAAIAPLLAKVRADAARRRAWAARYGPGGAAQISKDGRTAFAVVNYDKRANLLPDNTGKPVLDAIDADQRPGPQASPPAAR